MNVDRISMPSLFALQDRQAVSRSHASGTPAPLLPLIRETPKPEDYPLEALGEILGAAAASIVRIVQVPGATAAQSLLACASLLAQPHVNLEIDGRIMPASLFLLTIAESGDRKSASDRLAMSPVAAFERARWRVYEKQLEQFKKDMAAWKKATALTGGRRKCKQVSSEAVEPSPPMCPLMLIQEPTYEGLFKHLTTGQPSVALFSDEGGRMLGGHAMNKDNGLKTVAGLCELWDGSPLTRVRSGDGVEKLYDRRLSLHLMVQPVVSKLVFGNEIMEGQGFLARVLTWAPVSLAGTRGYRREDARNDAAICDYFARTDTLLALPSPRDPENPAQLAPRSVPLSYDAHATYREFHDLVEEQVGGHGKYASIKPFACKAAEQAARVALVLAFFHETELTEVAEIWMRRGCALVDGYLEEALRLWGEAPCDKDLQDAERVRLWLHRKGVALISGKELCRCGPKVARTKKRAEELTNVLVDHGWLRTIGDSSQCFANQLWEVACGS